MKQTQQRPGQTLPALPAVAGSSLVVQFALVVGCGWLSAQLSWVLAGGGCLRLAGCGFYFLLLHFYAQPHGLLYVQIHGPRVQQAHEQAAAPPIQMPSPGLSQVPDLT